MQACRRHERRPVGLFGLEDHTPLALISSLPAMAGKAPMDHWAKTTTNWAVHPYQDISRTVSKDDTQTIPKAVTGLSQSRYGTYVFSGGMRKSSGLCSARG